MLTIFWQALRRWRWQIVGWGGSLLLVALYLMWLYKPMLEQQAQVKALFDAYGEEMLAFFGGTADIFSAGGYLDFSFFSYIPVAVGILALVLGAGLVAADEEKGTLDLILAHPISRTALFWGRWLALVAVLAGTLLLTWAGFALGQPLAELDASVWQMLLPHMSLLALLMLFGTLALFLSLVLPSRAAAASVTGGLLVASYIVTSLATISDRLAPINNLSPLRYYQGGGAIDGLNWGYFLGIVGVTLALAMLAWRLFLRRDIRVSGEGAGLQWGSRARRGRAAGPARGMERGER
jgi:ABC-2 type transport system permease protein